MLSTCEVRYNTLGRKGNAGYIKYENIKFGAHGGHTRHRHVRPYFSHNQHRKSIGTSQSGSTKMKFYTKKKN